MITLWNVLEVAAFYVGCVVVGIYVTRALDGLPSRITRRE